MALTATSARVSDLEGLAFGELAACAVRAPVAVRCLDAQDTPTEIRLGASRSGAPYGALALLVRAGGGPLGWIGLPVPDRGAVIVPGLAPPAPPPPPQPAEQATGAELLTVVIATCGRTDAAVASVDSVLRAAAGRVEVVVVENRPRGSAVRSAITEAFPGEHRVRVVEEERRGLGCARNAGLRAAVGELVAFTDDDVQVDGRWIQALRAAFASGPGVACATGLIVPLELETPAQLQLERLAAYGKGFARRTYSLADPPPDQPLFPYTAGHFCSGANIAFRAGALRALGGFDPALGTGTPARGCEDLDVCIRLLQSGGTLVYEPAAIVWHRHPDTPAAVRRRAFDYGAALGALAAKQLLARRTRGEVLSRAPAALRHLADPRSRKNAARGPGFPRRLVWLERAGLASGPAGYLLSRARRCR
jgi:GT2 family glycosyltransferase